MSGNRPQRNRKPTTRDDFDYGDKGDTVSNSKNEAGSSGPPASQPISPPTWYPSTTRSASTGRILKKTDQVTSDVPSSSGSAHPATSTPTSPAAKKMKIGNPTVDSSSWTSVPVSRYLPSGRRPGAPSSVANFIRKARKQHEAEETTSNKVNIILKHARTEMNNEGTSGTTGKLNNNGPSTRTGPPSTSQRLFKPAPAHRHQVPLYPVKLTTASAVFRSSNLTAMSSSQRGQSPSTPAVPPHQFPLPPQPAPINLNVAPIPKDSDSSNTPILAIADSSDVEAPIAKKTILKSPSPIVSTSPINPSTQQEEPSTVAPHSRPHIAEITELKPSLLPSPIRAVRRSTKPELFDSVYSSPSTTHGPSTSTPTHRHAEGTPNLSDSYSSAQSRDSSLVLISDGQQNEQGHQLPPNVTTVPLFRIPKSEVLETVSNSSQIDEPPVQVVANVHVQPKKMVFNAPYIYPQKNLLLIKNPSNLFIAFRMSISSPIISVDHMCGIIGPMQTLHNFVTCNSFEFDEFSNETDKVVTEWLTVPTGEYQYNDQWFEEDCFSGRKTTEVTYSR